MFRAGGQGEPHGACVRGEQVLTKSISTTVLNAFSESPSIGAKLRSHISYLPARKVDKSDVQVARRTADDEIDPAVLFKRLFCGGLQVFGLSDVGLTG